MSSNQDSPIGPHDLGGQQSNGVDQQEAEISFWEQRVDAMVSLFHQKGVITDWAQLRKGVESLSASDYEQLSYYERWARSAARIAIQQGIISEQELEQRVQKLKAEQ